MNILVVLDKVLSCVVLTSMAFYIWSQLMDKKIDFKDYKVYILYASTIIFSILNYYLVNDFFRIVSVVFFLALVIKLLFRENIKITITTTIFYEIMIVVSEGIFALAINLLFGLNSQQIVETQFANFYANVIIALLTFILIKIKLTKKFYKFIISVVGKLNQNHLMIVNLFIVIMISILESTLYYNVDYRFLLVFNTLVIMFLFYTTLYSFKNRDNYIKVYDKYNTTLNSLKEYEMILDRYRISNHENKNQLFTIRNMIPRSNKKVVNYIDTILENKLKDNDKIMFETAKIPAGGLRGLIYSKILLMNDYNIEYLLEISKSIKTVDIINNIDDSTMLDICKIIGVYLDNAIQAVETLEQKHVNIQMYLEAKNLVISISNNYNGVIELDKIENKGYTSKGDNHGYGLTLAKEIIEHNKNLSNEKSITKDTFTQTLKIKM